MLNLRGTAIAIDGQGVLLLGPAGAGKSDLALRLIDEGAMLVADDGIDVVVRSDMPVAHAPGTIAGQIEVRGLGVMRQPAARVAEAVPIRLVVELVDRLEATERMPAWRTIDVAGIAVPAFSLYPFETSATAKLRQMLRAAVHRELLAE